MAAAVAIAAGLGAVLRYLVDVSLARRLGDALPWGTFVVNVSGSFALGLAVSTWSGDVLTVVGPGFLGGFTTLSTLVWESVALAERGQARASLVNLVGSAAAGVAGAALGLLLGSLG
jgi:fluoride exporter